MLNTTTTIPKCDHISSAELYMVKNQNIEAIKPYIYQKHYISDCCISQG